MPSYVFYGLITASTLLLAGFSRHRAEAAFAASVLCINWVLYALASYPETMAYSPAWAIYYATGVGFNVSTVWSATDAISAALIIIIAPERLWAAFLWALLGLQVMAHAILGYGQAPPFLYLTVLNWLYFGQITVFWLIGGSGIVHHIGGAVDRLSLRGRPATQALSEP